MLSDRQRDILSTVIREYIDSAEPVGSSCLVSKCKFDCSPATIRYEMSELEKEGYLHKPYTSAGRVPTDKGYRHFVDSLMSDRELSQKEQKLLQYELLCLRAKYNRLTKTTAKLMANLAHSLAISGLGKEELFHEAGMKDLLQQPEFKSPEQVYEIAEVLDYLDQNVTDITKKLSDKPAVYIGKENPLVPAKQSSMVVSGYRLPSGEQGLIAIVGPKRMRYSKNISIVSYITKLLGGTLVILFILT